MALMNDPKFKYKPDPHTRLLYTYPTKDHEQVRVLLVRHRGEFRVHFRKHWRPPGETDFVPTRVGVTVPASELVALVQALAQGAASIPSTPSRARFPMKAPTEGE